MERHSSVISRSYRIVDPTLLSGDRHMSSIVSAPNSQRKLASLARKRPAFISNAVRTAKYSYLSFLPLCLLQEFRRAANMYFLIIAVLQSIPLISPLTPVTAIAPLVFVIVVSLVREAVEDGRRRTADRIMNARPVVVVRGMDPMTVECANVEVGDIVRVNDKESLPADGILLASSEEDGSCFLDTSNLDGEANLKARKALETTQQIFSSMVDQTTAISVPRFFIQCEEPDQDLYRFAGNLSLDGKMHSLSDKQFLPRGSTLMNTRGALVLVVYTGHETKVMKNARPSRHKLSRVETITSRTVVAVFVLQMVLCAVGAICSTLFVSADSNNNMSAYDYAFTGSSSQKNVQVLSAVIVFLSYVVLMNTLIPISLVITVELVKTVHARFISWDAEMRNPRTGAGAIANTFSLTDELGQVRFIFTDKTGTLTQNQMAFRKCSVGGNMYGILPHQSSSSAPQGRHGSKGALVNPITCSREDQAANLALTSVASRASMVEPPQARPISRQSTSSFNSATLIAQALECGAPELRSVCTFRGILRNRDARESRLALAMALCHTVVCERVGSGLNVLGLDDSPTSAISGEIKYNADSPDECALVRGAEAMGIKLLAREGSQLLVSVTEESRDRGGAYLKTTTYTLMFEVLRVLQFSSDRKRMSVVLRDESGRVRLVCKGADSVILDRCEAFASPRSETMAHVDYFASEGFRILLFAERELDKRYFDGWLSRYDEAELDMDTKEERTEALVDELEQRLTLLGASAVEDKLQEGVPETISLFQKAGIKIWVLTGDKLETALEMGKLCHVVTPGMKEVLLTAPTRELMTRALEKALAESQDNQAIVVDGPALTWALLPTNRALFLQLTLKSATVLVCRSSPLQKALVVELVKSGVSCATLAVGDGANDVSMIRAAHVGVGVMGQEGMQAVRSADFAIQQFSHLGRLLLHHGRLSYLRTSKCINYFFYKNVLFTLPQFIYGPASLFSAQTFYSDLHITAYNVIFTACPVLVRGIMEMDVPEAMASRFPELYRAGIYDQYLSWSTLVKSIALATLHALVLTITPILIYQDNTPTTPAGDGGDMWSTGVASFIYVIWIAHQQIFLETWSWQRPVKIAYTASIVVSSICIHAIDQFEGDTRYAAGYITSTCRCWIGLVLSAGVCSIPWIAFKCWEENFSTVNPVHVLRRVRLFNKILDSSGVDTSGNTSRGNGVETVRGAEQVR